VKYVVVGVSEAAAGWDLGYGDVVSSTHPAFADDPVKLRRYLELGWVLPVVPPTPVETAMRALVGETMMRPRTRGRRG
jgi:hypothetical protein